MTGLFLIAAGLVGYWAWKTRETRAIRFGDVAAVVAALIGLQLFRRHEMPVALLAIGGAGWWYWWRSRGDAGTGMTREQASRLLDVPPDASAETVRAAHRRLVARVHPDAGGSADLAAQVNQARDTLLKRPYVIFLPFAAHRADHEISEESRMTHRFDPTSLREYDVRGIVGKTLGTADAYALGRGFATAVRRAGGTRVAVGRDGRVSSPMLEEALVKGLTDSGVNVVRIGIGPTPMLYFAEATLEVDAGVQITGSHNPGDYNGFKMVLQHGPFYGADIQSLGTMAEAGDWEEGSGDVTDADIEDLYVDRLLAGYSGGGFRIGWDNGNGAGGRILEKLVARLPGEHHLLYTEIDGTFPNHHPDPTEEKNLADLKALVAEKGLDFGIAFDGDADRIGAIDGQGRVIWGDQLLSILAEPVLRAVPGATIIADVKASQLLYDRIAELGGKPLMWKTGHSLIKVKMKETDSPLAGEMSGHIFFAHDYYGFDDAIYSAIRLIGAVRVLGGSLTALKDRMPALVNTPEMRFQVDESRKFAVIDEILDRLETSGAEVNRTDGARVNTPDGWWLLRASNTQDVLVARAEARDQAGLDRLLAQIDEQLALSGLERGPQAGH